jgi:hypothetical protein
MIAEDIYPFICPNHGRTEFWYLPDAQRVCEVCFPKGATPLGKAIPVNEDHLYKPKRKAA